MLPNLIIYSEPHEVETRLKELGLSSKPLLRAVQIWHLSKMNSTPNHPHPCVGITAWGEGVAALRAQLALIGWRRHSEKNYETVINPESDMALAMASGDRGTGLPDAQVSNRVKKGSGTESVVEKNQQQIELFALSETQSIRQPESSGSLTWLLLMYHDKATGEIRSELSLPLSFGNDGHVTSWKERIILASIPSGGQKITIETPETPDIGVDVKRKA